MPTVITYDVSREKQTEFKEWLKEHCGWKDKTPQDQNMPESTLIKPSTANGNADILNAISDIKNAEIAASTSVTAAIVISSNGAFEYYPPKRFQSLIS